MDLRFTLEEIAFRDEVRAFCRDALPSSVRTKMIVPAIVDWRIAIRPIAGRNKSTNPLEEQFP